MTCDKAHMPNGLLLPFQPHSRQSRVARIQQNCTDAFKNRLWQRTIQVKITNQAACLTKCINAEEAKRLYAMAERVKSGDPDNIEAQAARAYWQRLMGQDFRRGKEDIVNAVLNYGYAVVRAYIARAQVAYGLIPAFGIHHNNELNAFNLTDDMMEILRPFVDNMVFQMVKDGVFEEGQPSLTKENRAVLANIGQEICIIEGQKHAISNAADKMAASLVSAMENKSIACLSLPFLREEDDERNKG